MFGGNFGHCSRKGNVLIAGNAAGKILNFLEHNAGPDEVILSEGHDRRSMKAF